MISPITRRAFLATSAGAIASLAATSCPKPAQANAHTLPYGPVYGRIGKGGIGSGTKSKPSRGRVILLDGRVLEAYHVAAQRIAPGKSVLLSPDEHGEWSILYAEA